MRSRPLLRNGGGAGGGSGRAGGQAEGDQGRVGAAQAHAGQHCAPAHDWQLCRAAARDVPARARTADTEQREDGEEAQQGRATQLDATVGVRSWLCWLAGEFRQNARTDRGMLICAGCVGLVGLWWLHVVF